MPVLYEGYENIVYDYELNMTHYSQRSNIFNGLCSLQWCLIGICYFKAGGIASVWFIILAFSKSSKEHNLEVPKSSDI